MVGRPEQDSAVAHPTIPDQKIFTDGPDGQPLGTTVIAANFNTLTEELVGLVEAEGIDPDIANWGQVRAAIARMIGRRQPLKNRAINGSLDVWQRQVSFAVGDLERFAADRFAVQADGLGGSGAATVTRQAFAAGQTDVDGDPNYFLRHAQTAAASQAQPYIVHRIEGVRWTSARTVTISFWAMADQAFGLDLALQQDFGPGGSLAVSGGTQSFSITTSWQRFTYTVTLPSVAGQSIVDGAHLELKWVLPQSTAFVFDIADVQVELGDEATPVDRIPLGLSLALCQRYYEQSYPYGTFPGTVTEQGIAAGSDQNDRARAVTTRFRREKAVLPAMTWYSPSSGTAGSVSWNGTDRTVVQVHAVGKSATGYPEIAGNVSNVAPVEAHWTAESEI